MNHEQHIKGLLEQGLKQFAMERLVDPLTEYLLLLNKWNSAYNLTAVRAIDDMVNKHILDSLAIAPWIRGQRVLDVGTGAGLPGIPLAIACPEIQWVLLDSNGKKIRFLHEVKRHLNLKNIEIIELRAENYHPSQGFDTVTSRALSSLTQLISWTRHLIAEHGLWLAMKGRYPDTELAGIDKAYTVEHYTVQGIDGERCCVLIENTNEE